MLDSYPYRGKSKDEIAHAEEKSCFRKEVVLSEYASKCGGPFLNDTVSKAYGLQ